VEALGIEDLARCDDFAQLSDVERFGEAAIRQRREAGADIWFRSIFAFFIVDVNAKRVAHVAAARAQTQAWTDQQLHNATPFGQRPKFIIRDRDDKFGASFDRSANHGDAVRVNAASASPWVHVVQDGRGKCSDLRFAQRSGCGTQRG
jgi:hypothetical protein